MNQKTAIFFILFLITIGQISMDLYLPSMPAMGHYWQVTNKFIQHTMTTFLFGYSVSQLFYGPMSDRFGRRPILLTGLLIYLLSSIVCAFATSIGLLLCARLLQGLGAGAASVLSRAIMRDLFVGKQLAKVSVYAGMAWAIVPLVAPVFGGYIQHFIGWRANFIVLVIIAATALLLSLLFYSETQDFAHRQPLQLRIIFHHYRILLSHRIFVGNVLSLVAMYGAMIAFNIAAPFILQNQIGLNAVQFGWVIVLIAMGYLIGSVIADKLTNHFTYGQTIYFGWSLYFLSVSVFLIFGLFGYLNVWIVAIPMFFMMVSSSIVYPIGTAGSLLPFPKLAGIAGALYGFIVIASGGGVSIIIASLHELNQLPLAVVLLFLGIIAVIGYFVLVTLVGKKDQIRIE